jgi:glycogen synthase
MDDTMNFIDALAEQGTENSDDLQRDSVSERRRFIAVADPKPQAPERALALFCFEAPEGPVGTQVARTAAALARRSGVAHLFARHAFPAAAGVYVHAVGTESGMDLLAEVDEFTRRANNAFRAQFPHGADSVPVLGCEWSAAPILALRRGLGNARTILSLHSLERQRSDMTSELSWRIEEIERAALRETAALWLHDAATADLARVVVPECAGRITPASVPFPAEEFTGVADPGVIKRRYQIEPLDPTVLFVGDFSERYGPDLLIKAMPAVLKNHPRARLILAGCGDLYWPMKVYARYLLLEHAIRMPGNIEGSEMGELVQAADVIAVPSRAATPWWPILAGWAAGRPVVASHEAAPALLDHGADCVRIYPNPTSCVWGLERILCDAPFSAALAAAGRAKLEERFGWNAIAQQVEQLA